MDEASLASRTKNKKFFDVLLDARKQYGGKFRIFCDHGQRPITYNGLITRILLIEDVLKTAGMEGDNVGVLLPTSIGGAVTIYALQKMGKVPAMLNFSLGGRSLVNCCRTACVKTVITSRKFVELGKFEALIAAVEEAGLRVIWLEDHASSITKFKKVSAALKTIFMRSAPVKEGETDKPAIILFTSGSEGAPKGVVLSYKNLLVNHAQMYTRVDFYRSDRILNTMPIFHSFGLCGVFMPVTLGIFVYFYPSPLHYKTISTICYDERITFLPDTFLGGYAKAASDNYDFATIRMLVQEGEAGTLTQEIWFERFSIRITEGYGCRSVSGGRQQLLRPPQERHRQQFVAGIEYRIEPVEESTREGLDKGPNVMLGYSGQRTPAL